MSETPQRFKLMDVHNNGAVDVNVPIGDGVEIELAVEPDARVMFWGFNVGGEHNCLTPAEPKPFPDCELAERVRAFAAAQSKIIWERAA